MKTDDFSKDCISSYGISCKQLSKTLSLMRDTTCWQQFIPVMLYSIVQKLFAVNL